MRTPAMFLRVCEGAFFSRSSDDLYQTTNLSYPFTHTTCLSVYTTSTRSFCASITASMSL